MSDNSEALERAATAFIEARTALETQAGPRARRRVDRAFARLAALARPRIRYFARRYGLGDHLDDAEQAGAIALHRAAERYDPARALFSTFVHWHIRAEMQALRQKLHGGGHTAPLSLDALCDAGSEGWLVDADAMIATEAAASDRLAGLCARRLVAEWAERRASAIRPTAPPHRDRKLADQSALVRRQLLDVEAVAARLREADRHIVRRAIADIARHAGAKPH